jgi:hypothetical protein
VLGGPAAPAAAPAAPGAHRAPSQPSGASIAGGKKPSPEDKHTAQGTEAQPHAPGAPRQLYGP